jgi:hypothetical protein
VTNTFAAMPTNEVENNTAQFATVNEMPMYSSQTVLFPYPHEIGRVLGYSSILKRFEIHFRKTVPSLHPFQNN